MTDAFPTDTTGLADAVHSDTIDLTDGAEFRLTISPVRKRLGDHTVRMLGYNGSIPGPTMRVPEGSEIQVDVHNDGELDATVHWHGLRLDNRSDGTHETQQPIPIGGDFSCRVQFPDPGCTGTTRTSARTTARRWVSTAMSSSFRATPTTGRRCTVSSS